MKFFKVQKVMSKSDEAALNCAREFAHNEDLSIEVFDVDTSRGKAKARMRGVRATPTIVIGKYRIEGEFTPEQLRSKLKNLALLNSVQHGEKWRAKGFWSTLKNEKMLFNCCPRSMACSRVLSLFT